MYEEFELFENEFHDHLWPIDQKRLNDPNWVMRAEYFNMRFSSFLHLLSKFDFVRMYEVDSVIASGIYPEN